MMTDTVTGIRERVDVKRLKHEASQMGFLLSVVLEPYQARAVAWLRTKRRAAVHSPAGSGKTIIGAATLDSVLASKPRQGRVQIGWMCNTVEQASQARSALAHFPHIASCADVRVACAAAATDWSDCVALVVDECQHAVAQGWAEQIATCHGAVWGFTATPPVEGDERFPPYKAIFGNEFFTVEREEVGSRLVQARVVTLSATDPGLKDAIDQEIDGAMAYRRRYWHTGEVAMCRRTLADTSASEERKRAAVAMMAKFEAILWGQVAFQKCVELGIVRNKLRTRAAVAKAVAHRRDSVIVLVNHVDHAKAIAEMIPGAVACFSKMGVKKRRETLAEFAAGHCPCIVATSLADEGLDLPRANVLVLVSAGRSNARTEQRTGRVLRSFAGKSSGVIYDFADYWHPLAAKHSRVRHDLYRRLGYATL